MSIELTAVIILGGLGLMFAFVLGIANKIFFLRQDPVKIKIIDMLPGANCGACGFAGCDSYADAVVNQDISLDKCTVSTQEAVKKIGQILGKEVSETEVRVAVIACSGGVNCKDRFTYLGIDTCQAANAVFGGYKACIYGCLGFGDCVRVCPFDAITHTYGEVPVIDYDKCTGCGLCIKTCPKKIIELVPQKYSVHILCKSLDKGAVVRKICKTGCIGCGICAKICPKNDIVMKDNLARMKYALCDNCGLCIEKCPTKAIIRSLDK
jgi:RnfABCDGE-type electron transport complex B subunit